MDGFTKTNVLTMEKTKMAKNKEQEKALKRVEELEKVAEEALGEACQILRKNNLTYNFGISPLSQTYSGLKEEFIDDGFEIYPGWQTSRIC